MGEQYNHSEDGDFGEEECLEMQPPVTPKKRVLDENKDQDNVKNEIDSCLQYN